MDELKRQFNSFAPFIRDNTANTILLQRIQQRQTESLSDIMKLLLLMTVSSAHKVAFVDQWSNPSNAKSPAKFDENNAMRDVRNIMLNMLETDAAEASRQYKELLAYSAKSAYDANTVIFSPHTRVIHREKARSEGSGGGEEIESRLEAVERVFREYAAGFYRN